MRIKYNAPTTLTYSFFCTLVVLVDAFLLHGLTRALFTVPNAAGFDLLKPLNYLRLFTHIAGHADWAHLISNLAYILLLGPMLEETYGSMTMFLMIVVTGFVTGVLNACFFPAPLLGASGVVFMMILLASFTNHGKDDVPLTFILIVFLYLGREIMSAFKGDDISQFAHLAGGLCGSLFGFFSPRRRSTVRVGATRAVAVPGTTARSATATAKAATEHPARKGSPAMAASRHGKPATAEKARSRASMSLPKKEGKRPATKEAPQADRKDSPRATGKPAQRPRREGGR